MFSRAAFWARVWQLLVLPGLVLAPSLCILLFAPAPEEWALGPNPVLRYGPEIVVHVGFALSAEAALCCVLGGSMEVLNKSPQNLPVLHWAMLGPFAVMFPMLSLALGLDALAHGWRWPTLSMAVTTPSSAAVLAAAILPLCAAQATCFWIISELDGQPCRKTSRVPKLALDSDRSRRATLTQVGCNLGYAGVACGLGSGVVIEDTPFKQAVHEVLTIFFFGLFVVAFALIVLGSSLSGLAGRLRAVMFVGLAACSIAQLFFFLLVNQIWPNTLGLPHSIYAGSEYVNLLLLTSLFLTWVPDVAAELQPVR